MNRDKKVKKVKNKKPPVIKNIVVSIIDIKNYDQVHDCFVTQRGYYMDVLQLKTKDLNNCPEDEIEYDIMKYTKLYKVLGEDTKLVGLNFPINTHNQCSYIEYIKKRTRNPIFLRHLRRKENELITLSKYKMSREYYLFFFNENLEEFLKSRIRINQTLQQQKGSMVSSIPLEKRVQLLYRLCNKNKAF